MGGDQGVPQPGRDGVQRGGDLVRPHPQVVEPHAVEALGQVAEGGVAPVAHLVEHGPHLGDGRLGLGLGPGQPAAEVVAARAAQVESSEHDPPRYRRAGRAPQAIAGRTVGMESDRAELSALATSLDELTKRLTGVADRYQATPRQDIADSLFEVERSLLTATRKLDRVLRAMR